MTDMLYLHLEFSNKKCEWSIDLPFLCTKCGACCLLEDFLTAGEISAKPEDQTEVHSKVKTLFEELGKMWETDEAKYDDYIAHTPCPFLVNNVCSIYEIRPEGCRLFPKTAFGMQTQDCPALSRFKKQRLALIKGRPHVETFRITNSNEVEETIKPTKLTEKQYLSCIDKLSRAGITLDELALFNCLNGKNKK
jgi:Fe-S-cluster containining protein